VHYAGTVFFSPYFHITNVLCSPHFKVNLISVSKLLKLKTYDIHFVNDICTIQDVKSQKMIDLGDLCDGLYRLRMPPPSHSSHFSDNITTFPCNKVSSQSCNYVSCTSNIHIPSIAPWHFRLGHLSNQRLSQMHQLYPTIHVDNKSTCDICHFAKQKKLPYTLSSSIASSKFELLHFDIWGPIAKVSIHGHRYFLTIVDDHSRFLWTILLKNKYDVPSHIPNFIQLIQNQHNVTPKIIRSNNESEFLLSEFYASHGIIHQKSCVETPPQNGRVERKHQHILNVARALLFQSKLPNFFWSYVVLHVVFLINRVPTPVLNNQSPYHVSYNTLPDINSFEVFGCLCYASTLQAHRTKLQSRARKFVFLGYKSGYKGFVLYDLNTKEIFISRNVTFHESILPYISPPT